MKVVGLVGPKRSGKDTAAAALVEQRGFVRVGFADAVKEMAVRADPMITMPGGHSQTCLSLIVRFEGWEYAKAIPEVRRFLQALGTDAVRGVLGNDTWLKAWHRTVSKLGIYQRAEGDTLVTGPPNVVVPDVRFRNEADYLNLSVMDDVLLIRITRSGLDLSDAHVSETEQARIKCDVELVNDGSPEELHAKVLAVYDEWST